MFELCRVPVSLANFRRARYLVRFNFQPFFGNSLGNRLNYQNLLITHL